MTEIKVENGDLNIDGQMDCGYNALFAALQKIATMNSNMMSGKSELYHLHDYEKGPWGLSAEPSSGRTG